MLELLSVKRGPKAPPTATELPALLASSPAARFQEFATRHLRHVKAEWAGQPLVLAPWQRVQIIEPLLNTVGADGLRQYRTCYVEVPRKQGKSTLASALALFLEPLFFALDESAAAELSELSALFFLDLDLVLLLEPAVESLGGEESSALAFFFDFFLVAVELSL